jgi:tetratricopeptide (TPR) repeat protein
MVDPRIVQALEHADPNTRKKAVAALGKSNSAEALALLAKVYRNDPDPEVKELARKAGVYLKKQLDQNPDKPVSKPNRRIDADSPSAEAMIAAVQANKQAEQVALEEKAIQAERKAHPLYTKVMEADLDNLRLSALQKKKAEVALERAMDYSMSKKSDLANEELRKAYDINPALRIDPYTRSLTLQIIGGRDEDEAIKTLLNEAPLSTKKGSKNAPAGGNIFGFLLLIAGVVMVVSLFLPWVEFNPTGIDGEEMKFSGIDIVTNKDNSAYIFTVFNAVIDVDPNSISFNRDMKTYSPVLLGVGGLISIFTGVIGAISGVRRGYGLRTIFAGVIGSGALIWIYTSLDDFIAQFEQDPTMLFVPTIVLDMGFYVGLAGVGMAILFGLVVFIRR